MLLLGKRTVHLCLELVPALLWLVISKEGGYKRIRSLSCVQLYVVCSLPGSSPWGFGRQQYWKWVAISPPAGDLLAQGTHTSCKSPVLVADSLLWFIARCARSRKKSSECGGVTEEDVICYVYRVPFFQKFSILFFLLLILIWHFWISYCCLCPILIVS